MDLPDKEGRVAILKVHCRDKPLGGEVDLEQVAQRTTGFSGTVGGIVPANGALLERAATYRGAFDSSLSTLWVDDWTVLGIAGLID